MEYEYELDMGLNHEVCIACFDEKGDLYDARMAELKEIQCADEVHIPKGHYITVYSVSTLRH